MWDCGSYSSGQEGYDGIIGQDEEFVKG